MAKTRSEITSPVSTESRLLVPKERQVCIEMAQGETPHNRRALALLALDQGVTQADAGELSGLTIGQVRYWRDKFRQQRLDIFPKGSKKIAKRSGRQARGEEQTVPERPSSAKSSSSSETPAKTKTKKKKKQKAKEKPGKRRRKPDGKGTKASTKKKKQKSKKDTKPKSKKKRKAKAKRKSKKKNGKK